MGEPGDQELGDSTCETGRLGYPLIGSNTVPLRACIAASRSATVHPPSCDESGSGTEPPKQSLSIQMEFLCGSRWATFRIY